MTQKELVYYTVFTPSSKFLIETNIFYMSPVVSHLKANKNNAKGGLFTRTFYFLANNR